MPGCVCAVFDYSEDYVKKFSVYIKRAAALPFSVSFFTKRQALESFLKTQRVDFIFLPETEKEELAGFTKSLKKDDQGNPEIIILGDKKNYTGTLRVINKYQHVQGIISEMIELACEKQGLPEEGPAAASGIEILGIYSLANPSLAENFAVKQAKLSGVSGQILYINLFRFSGLEGSFDEPKEGDLGDVIYYFKTNSPKIRSAYLRARGKMMNLDVLTSPHNAADLDLIEDWKGFLEKLAQISAAQMIILDLTQGFSDIIGAFELCGRICLLLNPQKDMPKLKELEHYFEAEGRSDLLLKITKVDTGRF